MNELTKDDIKKVFVFHPKQAHKLLITENQASVIREVMSNRSMSARSLADSRELTIANASAQLIKLWHRGYLDRDEVTQGSGGVEYLYKSVFHE